MEPRRVVITGLGLVTPLGIGVKETWDRLLQGRSGISTITRFDVSEYPTRIAGEVDGFDPIQFMEKKDVKKTDLFIQFAIGASAFALEDSGLKIDDTNRDRVGVYVGSGIGGFTTIEREFEKILTRGPGRVSPFFIPGTIVNLASGQVSIRYGARGPNSAVCTACSTGSHAIGDAFKIIQRGDADAMIAGGAEAAITRLGIGGFCAMKALSSRNSEPERASRPFDLERDGFVMGEGAGIVVLEELQNALDRDADIVAEVVGYGMTGDAYHITSPDTSGSGAIRVMQTAMEDGNVPPEKVEYINAHGTSTKFNDAQETQAIKAAFGDHAQTMAISSTKSMTGHLLGAAGAVEAVITALTLREQELPPTINLENSDPECDLDYVPNKARKCNVEYALSNSFGFGGTNACLALKRFRD